MAFHRVRSLVVGVLILAFGAAGLPATHAASDPPARLDPALRTQLEEAGSRDGLLVFVHAERTRAAMDAVRDGGLELLDTFEAVGVAVGVGTPDRIRSLRTAEGVTYLEADEPIELFTNTSHLATRGAEALDGFTATDGTAVPGVDGSGVTIAVVDTGVDGTHPMFQQDDGTSKVVRNLKLACVQTIFAGQIHPSGCPGDHVPSDDASVRDAQWLDLTSTTNDTDTPSAGGHGTHVASIAAGAEVTSADGRELHGAAPGADLVGLSIGEGLSIYGGAAGLEWALDHHADPCGDGTCPPIRVLNNSWGAGGEHDPESVVSKLQDELVGAGVTVVWAAGNSGGDGTVDSVGRWAKSPTPGILGVANYNDGDTGSRNGALASTSSRGDDFRPTTYPDISAPGSAITAACRPQLPVCSTGFDTADPDYDTIGGTSMAAPHVAGIVAQLLEVDPSLTPGEIEDVLEDTAHEFVFGGPYEDDPRNPDSQTSFDKGHGLVDVVEAVSRLHGVTGPAALQPCESGSVVVRDADGDATRIIVDTPLESEDTLDVLEGRLGWDATGEALTFEILVTDLTEENPPGTQGIFFDFIFSYEGVEYFLTASRHVVNGESYELERIEPTRTTVVEDLDGEFNVDDDVVRVTLTNVDLEGTEVPALEEGDGLSGFSVVSRRQFGGVGPSFIPDADTAGGICPYTLGEGAVPPDSEPAPERVPDGTVSAESPTHEWTGGPTTDSRFVFGCGGISGRTCDVQFVEVVVPEGEATSFDVSITADLSLVNDYDLYVIGPDKTERVAGVLGSDETVSIADPAPGVYKIRVEAFLTVEASYQGTAQLVT